MVHVGAALVLAMAGVLAPAVSAAGPDANEAAAPEPSPYFVVLQTAGFVGYAAAGMGRELGTHHALSLLLGYVPEFAAGIELWQLALKYEWRLFDPVRIGTDDGEAVRLEPLHIGASLIYGHHPDLFVTLPDRYPGGYYPPTALRFTVNAGAALRRGPYAVFVEYAALDTGMKAYLENPGYFQDNYGYMGLEGIGSLAVGLRIHL